jgi:Na+-transporting NADH:ubiquinone oxidoreductase subunit C
MIFSVVMVVSVAIILSLMAMLLQPRQEKNVEVEKKMNILSSINVVSDKSDAVQLYDKHIRESFVINTEGKRFEGVDAFTVPSAPSRRSRWLNVPACFIAGQTTETRCISFP